MVSKEKKKVCKDCLADPVLRSLKIPRPALYPGPRCYTHDLAKKTADNLRIHGNRVVKVYNLSVGEYRRLYEFQGGKCYICERATGVSKRLSVDHDHACCPGPESCGACVRGLLCGPCNKDVIGHLRNDVAALRRAIEYLENPPARVLRLTVV